MTLVPSVSRCPFVVERQYGLENHPQEPMATAVSCTNRDGPDANCSALGIHDGARRPLDDGKRALHSALRARRGDCGMRLIRGRRFERGNERGTAQDTARKRRIAEAVEEASPEFSKELPPACVFVSREAR